MTGRPPQYDISLDTLSRQGSLRDYQRADAALVRTIEAQQHALMCGWGTPPQCFSFRLPESNSTNPIQFLLRVPPFCTKFRVSVLTNGLTNYFFQVGAVGVLQPSVFGSLERDAQLTWQDGSAMESLSEDSGFLEVLAAQQATWQTVSCNLHLLGGTLFSVALYPLLELVE